MAERAYLLLTALACAIAVGAVGYFIQKMFTETTNVWETFGVWGFVTGTEWVPSPSEGSPVFGAMPFIWGTLATSTIALTIATPIAIGVAIATTVMLPHRLRRPIASLIDLLAAVPSVVFGVWGFLVLAPWLKPMQEWFSEHNLGIGLLGGPVIGPSLLLGGVILAIMVLPIITSITREVLATVPMEQREAALGLGATRWEMIRGAMLPWAKSGIVGASVLGLGRAIGETVALALVLGSDERNVFDSVLQPGHTMASVIALQINEAGDLHREALIALGLLMLVIALVVNLGARAIIARSDRRGSGPGPIRSALTRLRGLLPSGGPGPRERSPIDLGSGRVHAVSRSRKVRSGIADALLYGSVVVALIPLGMIFGTLLIKGIPALSPAFFTGLPPADPNDFSGGVGHAIVGSFLTVGIATLIAAPLGLLVALFISETVAAPRPVRGLAKGVGLFVDVMLGMPSIVVGLIVYLGVVLVQGHFSATAGGIALAVLMFPVVVRAADEILRLVPRSLNEASLALGAPRWRTAVSVVLPFAAPGLVTGIMLGVARAAGETAPLLFTANGSQFFNWDPNEPTETLPHQIFTDILGIVTPATEQRAWGASLVLVTIILVFTLLARLIGRRSRVGLR